MRVLLVKLSSLGDVIHTLPALTDAYRALPDVAFDWAVEENFAEIPAWHPAVDRVIPAALRRWRRNWRGTGVERRVFRAWLREREYDRVIDAQGLIKSAWVARLARGPRWGLDRASAREPLAAWGYAHRVRVSRDQHAVVRTRLLLAAALGYPSPDSPASYGLQRDRLPAPPVPPGDLLFLHGTTWPSKHWPEIYWRELTAMAAAAGHRILLPWGSEAERARAESMAAAGGDAATVLPRCGLGELAALIGASRAVVGVDTGLAHLAAALGTPSVTLYGATRADRTGTFGERQVHLAADFPCSPCLARECRYRGESAVQPACYATLGPERVWHELGALLAFGSQEAAHDA